MWMLAPLTCHMGCTGVFTLPSLITARKSATLPTAFHNLALTIFFYIFQFTFLSGRPEGRPHLLDGVSLRVNDHSVSVSLAWLIMDVPAILPPAFVNAFKFTGTRLGVVGLFVSVHVSLSFQFQIIVTD